MSPRNTGSTRRCVRPSRPVLLALGGIAAFTLIARLLGYRLGGRVVVRCRQGHLFSTLWIPGVKLTALDFGVARWQRCPVGAHWSLITPVREADLSERERQLAAVRSRRDGCRARKVRRPR